MHCGVLKGSASLFQVSCEEGARAIPAGRFSGFGSAKAGTSPLAPFFPQDFPQLPGSPQPRCIGLCISDGCDAKHIRGAGVY